MLGRATTPASQQRKAGAVGSAPFSKEEKPLAGQEGLVVSGFKVEYQITSTRVDYIDREYCVLAIGDGATVLQHAFLSIKRQIPPGVFPLLTWNEVEDAKRYAVYKKEGNEFGFIGSTDDTQFVDCNICPDTENTPSNATFLEALTSLPSLS